MLQQRKPAMNRRTWLLTQPMLILQKTKHPITLKQSIIRNEEHAHIFQSLNKKMTSIVSYEDYEDCVRINHSVQWYDPVEQTEKTKLSQQLYILEEHII